jgi:hypothetical protein
MRTQSLGKGFRIDIDGRSFLATYTTLNVVKDYGEFSEDEKRSEGGSDVTSEEIVVAMIEDVVKGFKEETGENKELVRRGWEV